MPADAIRQAIRRARQQAAQARTRIGRHLHLRAAARLEDAHQAALEAQRCMRDGERYEADPGGAGDAPGPELPPEGNYRRL